MSGHVFVVHGKIEQLTHDAAVIPVDGSLSFNRIWEPLLGQPWPTAPSTWSKGWGRIDGAEQWLVQVADGDYSLVLERLSSAVDDVASQRLTPKGGRERPLVALPVLGIGRGGHRHEQGRVLKLLVDHLHGLAESTGLDFAIVTPEASVFAAAQYVRRTRAVSQGIDRVATDIGNRARRDELALFLGAGTSMPAGLPSWKELVEQLAAEVPGADSEAFRALGATDQAELIQATAGKTFQQQVADIVRTAPRPALLHGLLAGLGVRNAVTTNYDRFYERAVEASERSMESVLPWASAVGSERWALKLHGDVERPDSIVLTRRHMVTYDAQNRPSAALLQSVLLTKHLLVVGTSLTDDNVLRLAHEVQAYRDHHRPDSHDRFGTQLDASEGGDRLRARLWDGQLEWIYLGDLGTDSPRRALELVLDRAGTYATRDASWLLDRRFAGLLGEDADRELADQARELVRAARSRDSGTWGPLVEGLDQLGARHE
ncbi:SIR2 family protein [Knoellia sp. CPCC 206450]|uniref:SIR2 family protein n=1 Tax=Knoellia tibetensis TaxID=3404798 RepID=UPI003B438DF6